MQHFFALISTDVYFNDCRDARRPFSSSSNSLCFFFLKLPEMHMHLPSSAEFNYVPQFFDPHVHVFSQYSKSFFNCKNVVFATLVLWYTLLGRSKNVRKEAMTLYQFEFSSNELFLSSFKLTRKLKERFPIYSLPQPMHSCPHINILDQDNTFVKITETRLTYLWVKLFLFWDMLPTLLTTKWYVINLHTILKISVWV
jgi:hypothetical protein